MFSLLFALLVTCLLPRAVLGQVVGTPVGFGSKATGGGNIDPVAPKTTEELRSYLKDDQPRVILVTKTFDITGLEGTTTATGCRPSSNTCGSSGQDAINAANNWCGNNPSITVTYDIAAQSPIMVNSNKSLVGVGSSGVLKGKGLKIQDVTNVIVQNVHITDFNPQYM